MVPINLGKKWTTNFFKSRIFMQPMRGLVDMTHQGFFLNFFFSGVGEGCVCVCVCVLFFGFLRKSALLPHAIMNCCLLSLAPWPPCTLPIYIPLFCILVIFHTPCM